MIQGAAIGATGGCAPSMTERKLDNGFQCINIAAFCRCFCASHHESRAEASSAGADRPLVRSAVAAGFDPERNLHLLVFSHLPTCDRSHYGKLRRCRRHWHLALCACPMDAQLRQSAGLGLQPLQFRARHARAGSSAALVLCLPLHGRWSGVSDWACAGGRVARLCAKVIGCSWRFAHDSFLYWSSLRLGLAAAVAASARQGKVQRAAKDFLRFGHLGGSARRRVRLGHSQAGTALVLCESFWWL